MGSSKKIYTGYLDDITSKKILLNISHLRNGTYRLIIVNKNRICKEKSKRFKKIISNENNKPDPTVIRRI